MSGGRVVALVDDDAAVLDSLKFLLELSGYTVAAYRSALAFLEDLASRPACLIVDHHMPVMTGLALLARMREQGDSTPALLITGLSSPAIVARAQRLGVDVLEKPPDETDVLKFINAHI